jgi:peptide/nickel transport system permease protein
MTTSAFTKNLLLRAATLNPLTATGLFLFIIILLVSFGAPLIAPYDPLDQDILGRLEGVSAEHWLGTDVFGRDTLSRILHGAKLSLIIGLISTGIALIIGTALGIIAGYYGGWIDIVVMRMMDILLAFPTLITGLLIVAVLGTSPVNIVVAIAVTLAPNFARVARAPTITLREREFVEACRALGYSNTRIMVVHILPNVIGEVVVLASLWTASAIMIEAYLSFIGLGVAPPTPTLGGMIRQGLDNILEVPWVTIYPGLAIMLIVLALNLIGDGVRDAIDPKAGGRS